MKVYLNLQYAIRNEESCSYLVKILERTEYRISNEEYDHIDAVTLIPPIIGYIIKLLNGNNPNEAINTIHQELKISKVVIHNFILKIIDNRNFIKMQFLSHTIILPPYILTKNKSKAKIITFKGFAPFQNIVLKRPSFPLFLSLMITSKCKTDCIYCYADRSRKDDLVTDSILKTIDQAQSEGVLYLNISGGDIFAMKEWRKILKKLFEYDFHPYISTKIPLNEADIKFLKKIGMKSIQFSIDSFMQEEIYPIIRREEQYIAKVQNTFALLQKYGIRLRVRSVITNLNSSLNSVGNTLKILERYNNIIEHWDITPAFFSEFKGRYGNYQPKNETLKEILDFISNKETSIKISKKSLENKLNFSTNEYKDIDHFVCHNKKCIANTYSMFVISNGKVTLCELLYYNQDFYTGDISKNTLKEIWNNETSLKLFAPKQKDIVNTEGNPCYFCSLFEKCKTQNGKNICYVDIIKAYGAQKYDYPDPRCPKAPVHNPELLLY